MKEFDCYECEHRGTIAGDCHTICKHPSIKQDSNPFGAMVDMLSGKNVDAAEKLNIRGNSHGIRSGWFMWPANFDPVWLENCDGFKRKQSSTQKEPPCES